MTSVCTCLSDVILIQAGAELCQAQDQFGLTAVAEIILMLSSGFSNLFQTLLE
jgi:hypothetical protein